MGNIPASNNCSRCLAKVMESGEFSDLKLVCQGREFRVHKAIVCGQSPVIKAAVSGGFEESRTNVVAMDAFQPGTVKRLVQFMYTGDYDDPGDGSASPPPGQPACPSRGGGAHLLEHVRVNSIGDYYGVDELVALANQKTCLFLDNADEKSWMPSLPAVAEAAIASTGDAELLDMLAAAVAKSISTPWDLDQFRSLGVMSDFSVRVLQNCAEVIEGLRGELRESKLQAREPEQAGSGNESHGAKRMQRSEVEAFGMRPCLC